MSAIAIKDYSREIFSEAELQSFRLTFSKACCLVGVTLVISGAGLDYMAYPERFQEFLYARIATATLMLGVYGALFLDWGISHIQMLTMLWLIFPQVMIVGMISVTDGATSIYATGLHLAVFAAGSLLPLGLMRGFVFGVATYTLYIVACIYQDGTGVFSPIFVANSLFLWFTILLSVFCTYFNERGRYHLFRQKVAKNAELERVNARLVEIKGQLLQQEKMAALGTLSAGLLHEVNNPVNFCLMAVEVGLEDPLIEQSSGLKECLLDAQTGMRRVQQIVSDLKTFAYRGPTEGMDVPFYFDKALDSARRLSSHELRPVRVTTDLDPNGLVRGDEALIIGVLINLLTNAALALVSKGHADPLIEVKSRWANGRLHVSVCDNGRGIAPHNLERIFEPFFTTRDVGKGLGLGLSISYSVIENHGGRLVAESEEGAWTRMSFDLPSGEDHG